METPGSSAHHAWEWGSISWVGSGQVKGAFSSQPFAQDPQLSWRRRKDSEVRLLPGKKPFDREFKGGSWCLLAAVVKSGVSALLSWEWGSRESLWFKQHSLLPFLLIFPKRIFFICCFLLGPFPQGLNGWVFKIIFTSFTVELPMLSCSKSIFYLIILNWKFLVEGWTTFWTAVNIFIYCSNGL